MKTCRTPTPPSSEAKDGWFVVAYDIADGHARHAVANLLKGYGLRVQYSVFECCLNERELRRLTAALRRIATAPGDRVELFACCRAGAREGIDDLPSGYWIS